MALVLGTWDEKTTLKARRMARNFEQALLDNANHLNIRSHILSRREKDQDPSILVGLRWTGDDELFRQIYFWVGTTEDRPYPHLCKYLYSLGEKDEGALCDRMVMISEYLTERQQVTRMLRSLDQLCSLTRDELAGCPDASR